jgi:hypothetical protein
LFLRKTLKALGDFMACSTQATALLNAIDAYSKSRQGFATLANDLNTL